MVQECKRLFAKPTDKTGQKPARTRISEKQNFSKYADIQKKKLGLVSTPLVVPSTAETHTGGGAALGKPEGSQARRHSRKIDLK